MTLVGEMPEGVGGAGEEMRVLLQAAMLLPALGTLMGGQTVPPPMSAGNPQAWLCVLPATQTQRDRQGQRLPSGTLQDQFH